MPLWEHELKNAYIGEYKEWKPWANTLLYLKFENNLNDSSWNNVSVSWAWISYGTIWDKYYVERTGSWDGTYIQPTASIWNVIGTWDFCVSFYGYPIPNTSTTYWWSCFFMNWYDGSNPFPWIYIEYWTGTWYPRMWTNVENYDNPSLSANQWHHFCMTRRSGTIYCYIDGELKWTVASTRNLNNMDKFFLLNRSSFNWHARPTTWARMSEVIYEKQWWEETEIQTYYNQTKANYWL